MKTINAFAFLRRALWCAAVALCLLPFRTAQAAQFIPLGEETYPRGVSGDGAFVVGWNRTLNNPNEPDDALRWTSSGQVLNLGDLPGFCCSEAAAASLTGSVVVGYSSRGDFVDSTPFRWTESAGMQGLGRLRPSDNYVSSSDVSADGSIVIGASGFYATGVLTYEAFRWTEGMGMVGLGTLPGDTRSWANGISADGLVIVGSSVGMSMTNPSIYEAFRWTEAGGMQGLGVLPGYDWSSARGISADGSTVVGYSIKNSSRLEYEAFRWTASTGMVGLGHLPGHQSSFATGVSGDGSVVVGHGLTQARDEALIWDETHGMRRLQDVLTAEGLDLTGWQLLDATGVSDDGNVIAGWGNNPSGAPEGWIARLNTVLGDPDFNNDGQLNCTDIDAVSGRDRGRHQ